MEHILGENETKILLRRRLQFADYLWSCFVVSAKKFAVGDKICRKAIWDGRLFPMGS